MSREGRSVGLLSGKNALIYGGAGAIGAAVAQSYAREGAHVFLGGRNPEAVERVAAAIRESGGVAESAHVDAADISSLEAHVQSVLESTGAIDIAFNATSNQDVQGTPLVDLSYADFLRPVQTATTIHFLISTIVGRKMSEQGSGVILAMAGVREAVANLGGSHVAWSALAGLCRQLACELGPSGVRVAWILSPGSPDSHDTADPDSSASMLGRLPLYGEVAEAATFLASDMAATMTATELNLTGGAIVD
jgi:NAD(P)-dependent dehydrogenase (short-subunit alcohol dehydrogenase family)